MSRVKINFPETSIFTTDLIITIADINYGGHLGNDRFLTLMQEARLRWLRSLGFANEKEISPPIGTIIADAAIQFKAEVFHGEEITIALAIDEIGRKGFDLLYKLNNKQNLVVALGKTAVVCMDYEEGKAVSIPAILKDQL